MSGVVGREGPRRRVVSRGTERQRIRDLDAIISPILSRHRFRRSWVFVNFPPAWVQHLRVDDDAVAPPKIFCPQGPEILLNHKNHYIL